MTENLFENNTGYNCVTHRTVYLIFYVIYFDRSNIGVRDSKSLQIIYTCYADVNIMLTKRNRLCPHSFYFIKYTRSNKGGIPEKIHCLYSYRLD